VYLDPAQSRLVEQYRSYEKQHNDAAHRPYSGGNFSTKRPFAIPNELFGLEKIADNRERLFAIRQLKSEWRDNPKSPFSDTAHPEHANAVSAMDRLYRAEAELSAPGDSE
jgi:hypothetical protein